MSSTATRRLNANNWFSNRAGRAPDFTRNVFGGAVGGPVRIPQLYNGKDRTSSFTITKGPAIERCDQDDDGADAKERMGDFSDTRTSTGQLITVFNPYDTYKRAGGKTLRMPFRETVPVSMQDPVALNVMKYYPAPTSDGLAFTHVNNFFAQGVNVSSSDQMDIKLDHNISEKPRFTRGIASTGAAAFRLCIGQLCGQFDKRGQLLAHAEFRIRLHAHTKSHDDLRVPLRIVAAAREHESEEPGLRSDIARIAAGLLTSGVKMFPKFSRKAIRNWGRSVTG